MNLPISIKFQIPDPAQKMTLCIPKQIESTPHPPNAAVRRTVHEYCLLPQTTDGFHPHQQHRSCCTASNHNQTRNRRPVTFRRQILHMAQDSAALKIQYRFAYKLFFCHDMYPEIILVEKAPFHKSKILFFSSCRQEKHIFISN